MNAVVLRSGFFGLFLGFVSSVSLSQSILPEDSEIQIDLPISTTQPHPTAEYRSQMSHLLSLVGLLGEQRDLIQVNYSFLETIAMSFDHTVGRCMPSAHDANHRKRLSILAEYARNLQDHAAKKSSFALVSANMVSMGCAQCHREIPTIGDEHDWEVLMRKGWDAIIDECHRVMDPASPVTVPPGAAPQGVRNPFVCKHMYGLVGLMRTILTASSVAREDFGLLNSVVLEMKRIAMLLLEKKLIHKGEEPLKHLEAMANQVSELAMAKKSEAWEKAGKIHEACISCHIAGGWHTESRKR